MTIQSGAARHNTDLAGAPRLAVQAGWLLIVISLTALFAAAVPVRLYELQTSASSAQNAGQLASLGPVVALTLGPQEFAALQALGLSQPFYAAYVVAAETFLALICLVMALFIYWRRSQDWMALLVALSLVLLGTSSVAPELAILAAVWPSWGWINLNVVYAASSALGMVSHVHILFLAPDGRFVPRWTLPWAAAFTGGMFALIGYAASVAGLWGALSILVIFVGLPAWLALVTLGVISQVHRYRRVSGAVQRQQTKWMVVGFTGFTLGFAVNAFGLLASSQLSGLPRLLLILARVPLVNLCMLLLPLGLGFSILRYRLWDIDLIIRRTLVYSGLTAALVLVYLSSVILLQILFQTLTGASQSTLVTVASTLVIAALFIPVRRRVQTVIDRLFYRRKYDAAKIMAIFSGTLRDETDLDALTARTLQVVDETMHPTHLDLWLR